MLVEVAEQHQPHRRNTLHDRDALVSHQLVDALAVQMWARQHQLGADHRRGIRGAPGVGVEHRDHQQQRRAAVDVEGVPRQRQHRVQHRRPMGVQHAFGVSGGAGGVAQRRCAAFVEFGPVVVGGLRGDELVEAQQSLGGDAGQVGHVLAVGHGDEMLDRLQLGCQRSDQSREGDVEEQHPVFGMVDDVDDLLGEEPRVDGVHHRAGTRHPVIEREVTVAVPGQRGHPVRRLDAQLGQRVGHLLGLVPDLRPGGPPDRPLGQARDDLGVGVTCRGVLDQRGDEQRAVLHQSQHAVRLASTGRASSRFAGFPRPHLFRSTGGCASGSDTPPAPPRRVGASASSPVRA